ncbi:UbiA family prenyltransferase [Fulvivirgaceae bacterium PWU4]|uniref:UbiA family prenyltransferase n=1 Tax=Chryseosolibacter histidini TaxID=2782349 RepID=A0AAP2GH66_9BACT|nr:UbiA family prenyltransferase [Chryseosolibacter histidini]MBT1695721.1 UbiA family prenyltransferase [Chryseosolibacter histidini]
MSEVAASNPEFFQTETQKQPATAKDYFAMTRPDYWLKNIFILPGMLFALAVYHTPLDFSLIAKIVLGIVSTCLIASANYVINEYLDAEFDKYHPLKHMRTSVVRVVNPWIVYTQYAALAIIGLALGYLISSKFFFAGAFLLFMGVMYNVRPFRSKERVYLDVLSESINNPIRFALGWFMVTPAVGLHMDNRWDLEFFDSMPPLSIIIAYWMGGAFLMATKRFAEYRLIGNRELAGLYRRSFKYYTENSLLISMFFYALTCAFFLGIFLVKNRIEMLLSFPFFALLFAWYLKIGLLKNSPVQGSEKLWTRKWFMTYLVLFTILVCTLMFVDIPWLRWFLIKTRN